MLKTLPGGTDKNAQLWIIQQISDSSVDNDQSVVIVAIMRA